ncbi:MAG: CarD family transcriptional regulator [Hyphomicrobiaceae bacterium]
MAQKKKTPPKAAVAKPAAVKKATAIKAVAKPHAKVTASASQPAKPEKSANVATNENKAPVKVSVTQTAAKPIKPAKATAAVKAAVPPKPTAAAKPAPAKVAAKPVVTKPTAAVKKSAVTVATPKKAAEVRVPTPAATLPGAAAIAKPAAAPQRAQPAAVSKPAAPNKITTPMLTRPLPGQPPRVAPSAPPAVAAVNGAAAAAAAKKPVSSRHGFKTGEAVVYPAHGVGRIVGIEEQEIAGISLELFVIQFDKDKMTLRVPTSKLASVGMRKLAEDGIVRKAMETLKGKARIKRTMWSRRAQEYEAKINSGDLIAIAEVVRDLYRSEAQPEQSYSERQLYEAALDRMGREIAAVEKLDERGAMQRITEVLSKSAKGRRAAEEEAASAAEADADSGTEDVKAA